MTTDNTELRDLIPSPDNYNHPIDKHSWDKGYAARDTELQAKIAAKDALLEEMAGILKQSQTCGMDGHSCGICEALTKYEKEKENDQ